MADSPPLTALVEEWALDTPAQALVDRFLIGYPRGGTFVKGQPVQVHAPQGAADADLARRATDFGLQRIADLGPALSQASGVLILPRGAGERAWEAGLQSALEHCPARAKIFVHGFLAAGLGAARQAVEQAVSKGRVLLAGTHLPATWRLPPAELEIGEELAEALVVSLGADEVAELHGIDLLLALVERRWTGETGVASVTMLAGDEVWRAGDKKLWSGELLGAALSRSDRPQGDPVRDGRTQNLWGLGLVPRLAAAPRAYLIEHTDGLRSTILVLNGVVGDMNFALRRRGGEILSAQVFRAPSPNAHHFSTLARAIGRFLQGDEPPWPVERNVLAAGLREAFAEARAKAGSKLPTPQLKIAYRPSRFPVPVED